MLKDRGEKPRRQVPFCVPLLAVDGSCCLWRRLRHRRARSPDCPLPFEQRPVSLLEIVDLADTARNSSSRNHLIPVPRQSGNCFEVLPPTHRSRVSSVIPPRLLRCWERFRPSRPFPSEFHSAYPCRTLADYIVLNRKSFSAGGRSFYSAAETGVVCGALACSSCGIDKEISAAIFGLSSGEHEREQRLN